MPEPQSKIIDGLAHPLWFRPNTTDNWCLKKVFADREYAIDFTDEPKVIIDAGANVGYASVFFADRYPNAMVLAIEPESANFALLSRNADPYENIVPIHAALWHCPEQIAISDPGKGAWAFRTSARSDVRETVEYVRGVTVQQIIEEHGVSQIDLLKIDIEGSEKQVFEHSVDWIERVQMIVIELHDRFAPGCTTAFDAATNNGFPVRWRQGENVCVARKGVPWDKLPACPARIDKLEAYTTTANRIVATMLCGNNEAIVAESVRSVIDWVDAFLLIDTGITDDSVQIAREIAGDKLLVRTFAWCNDFALARNFSLEAAAAADATWALTIDTDERMIVSGYDDIETLRAVLSSDPAVLAWLVPARDGSYDKERLIRVPTRLQWKGRTHESLVGAAANERRVLPGWKFFEERKTPEQFQRKLQRDLDILEEETRDKPDEPRWWYYLGQTYEGLAQPAEALNAFRRCAQIRHGWAEQAAWACYKAASMALALKRHDEALDLCTLGLERQPESPELAWLAGYVCYRMGRLDQAIEWSRVAIALGHFEGRRAGQQRISFRHLPGWYEGPYDVLRYAYRKLGQAELAFECDAKFHAAKRLRDHSREQTCSRSALSGDSTYNSPGPGLVPAREGGPHPSPLPEGEGAGIRVAVLGLYSSGSTATATMLHHLGVCLGREFFADHYEPRWLAEQLRGWWQEPELVEATPRAERVRVLAAWIENLERDFVRGASGPQACGAKHPLLTLCGPDLIEAWGPKTKFIWCRRPVEESIASLVRRGWWPGREAAIQHRLWQAAEEFFAARSHFAIEFADVLRDPARQTGRLVEFLGLQPTNAQCQAAAGSIDRGGRSPRALSTVSGNEDLRDLVPHRVNRPS